MPSCAIMQPTYLPWSGYFHLANKVDTFVILDDVQFERSSWQNRNYILVNGKKHLLSVPVQQAPLQTKICDILIAPDPNWKKKHLHSIQLAYPSLWRDTQLREPLIAVIEKPYRTLADLNVALISLLFFWLNISCKTLRASELMCGGKRSHHVVEICQAVQADTYYSPTGSRGYLEADQFESFSGIKLLYNEYNPSPYVQSKTPEFVSHLSIIDVIGHGGLELANAYVKKGSPDANHN
jgi:hypothetical protein